MSKRWMGYVGLLSGTVLACTGCHWGHASFSYVDERPVRVYDDEPVAVEHYDRPAIIVASHVCDERCRDHYWNGRKLVVLTGHRHGPGCGHYWNGTYWVVARRGRGVTRLHRSAPRVIHGERVHGPSSGDVWNRSRRAWVRVRRGHIHGPRCGHVYLEGRWTIRR